MWCEELSHFELLLRLGILVVVGEVRLLEVMQSSDACIAVVYTLFAINSGKDLMAKRIFSLISARLFCGICCGTMAFIAVVIRVCHNERHSSSIVYGVSYISCCHQFSSLSLISLSRSLLKQLSTAALSLNLTSMRPLA